MFISFWVWSLFHIFSKAPLVPGVNWIGIKMRINFELSPLKWRQVLINKKFSFPVSNIYGFIFFSSLEYLVNPALGGNRSINQDRILSRLLLLSLSRYFPKIAQLSSKTNFVTNIFFQACKISKCLFIPCKNYVRLFSTFKPPKNFQHNQA